MANLGDLSSRASVDNNLLDRIEALERALRQLQTRPIVARTLGDIVPDLGDINAGRFLALLVGGDPTDPDAVGSFMSATAVVFPDGTAMNFGTVKQGQPSAGFNTEGDFIAARSALKINENGQTLTGIGFPIQHILTENGVTRKIRLGGYMPSGSSIPAWSIDYGDPGVYDVAVQNPGFETGDMSGWTGTGTVGIVGPSSADAHSGLYCFAMNLDNLDAEGELRSVKFNITPNTNYQLSFYFRAHSAVDLLTAAISWYDASNNFLSNTDKVITTRPSSYTQLLSAVRSPANSAKAEIVISAYCDGSLINRWVWLDDFKFEDLDNIVELRFEEDGLTYSRGLWPEQWSGGWDAAQAFGSNGTQKSMAYNTESSMWGGYMSLLSQADASNGDWYVLKIPLAAGTYEWRMNYRSATDRGKVDLYVNGTKVSGATPFDMRSTTPTSNLGWTVSGISIPKHGVHEFRVIVNGTSGSYYRVAASFVTVRRTG